MERPIRVLFVDHEPRLSGGQQDLVDLVESLDPARVEVHVALPASGPLEERLAAAGARIHHVEIDPELRHLSRWVITRRPHVALRYLGAFAGATRRLGRLVREVRPDVVHTNSMKAHLLAIAPVRRRRIPLVWHVRDILQPGWMRRGFVAAGGLFATRIVVLSRVTGEQFASSRRATRKVRVVYNGLHLDRYRGVAAARWRRRLGASGGEVIVGMVGQIAHWKGQDVFIDAAGKLAGRYPDARFAIVGECLFPENEDTYSWKIRERAKELGLGGRMVFTGWSDQIGATMNAIDVLVHASRLPEPFGRVIVEGMAAGKPVVASRAGAGPEIVTEGSGRLVDPGDPDALAEALDDLVGDAYTRLSVGKAAAEAAKRFDISQTARGVMGVYAEVL
jgi:glycosyltransferase involved in cell wall biosynthesis